MPYIKGKATDLHDLLAKTVAWATDAAIHGDDAWTLKRNDAWPRGTIFEAKGVNGVGKCYIGMMVMDFVIGKTYSKWLLSNANIGKQLIWNTRALGLTGKDFAHADGAGSFSIIDNPYKPAGNPPVYSFGTPEIVHQNGSFLVFGVFKQYEDGLDWNEQPGAIDVHDIGQMEIPFYTNGGAPSYLPPPIYPGLGYPGIGIPEGEPSLGTFDYWLVKDASRITLATNNDGQWDVGHAGMLVPFHSRMQYAFPAVVAGSCTGLRPVGFFGAYNAPHIGGMIDFSYKNHSLSRSLPLAPCSNGMSQVALCMPEGTWKYFSNWNQGLQPTTSPIDGYYFTVPRPVRVAHTTGYLVTPTDVELGDIQPGLATDHIITSAISLVQSDANTGSVNQLGTIWGMAWPGAEDTYGEVAVNGKASLILPNGSKDRMWYVPNGKTGITDPDQLVDMYAEIAKYGKQFRMLINLEV